MCECRINLIKNQRMVLEGNVWLFDFESEESKCSQTEINIIEVNPDNERKMMPQ
jgi:hypothetical protein